jgi:tRNA threonylcarbamoyladenosine biosynthesis protein TsaE
MPILDENTLEIFSRSAAQTRRMGIRLGSLLRAGDVVCMEGELGAGKTTFVQGVARGWGALEEASSPTFVLVNLYRRADGAPLYHVDAYRLGSALEAEELGLEDMLSEAPLLIEWADKIPEALPSEHLWLTLSYVEEEQRQIVVIAKGSRHRELLESFRKAAFGV